MSYSFHNDVVLTYWRNRTLTAHEAFAQMAAFLRRLQVFSEVFSNLYVSNYVIDDQIRLQPDFSNFEAEVAACVDHDIGYTNVDPQDLAFSMTSCSAMGFNGYFSTVPSDQDNGCWIKIICGQEEDGLEGAPNQVHILVSPELATPLFLRGLVKQTVQFWRPANALLSQSKVSNSVKQPVAEASIGWLTYMANPDVGQVLPDDVAREAFADGVLIQASDRPGRVDDADYIDRLIRLRDTLRPLGFLDKQRRFYKTTVSPEYSEYVKRRLGKSEQH